MTSSEEQNYFPKEACDRMFFIIGPFTVKSRFSRSPDELILSCQKYVMKQPERGSERLRSELNANINMLAHWLSRNATMLTI